MTRLEQEHDNLRVALSWLSERKEHELLLRLGSALCWFWSVHGHIKEGYGWLEGVLAEHEAIPALIRAKALNSAGALAYHLGLYNQTELFCQESLALYRQLDEKLGCAMALYWLGNVACWVKQDYEQAQVYAEECLVLRTACNDGSSIADALLMLGYIALNQGNYIEARRFFEQGLAQFREVDDAWGIAYTTRSLARVLLEQGDIPQASVLIEESLAISTELDYVSGIAYTLSFQGDIALRQGDVPRAHALIRESLTRHRERGLQAGIAESLVLLAKVFVAEAQYKGAQQLYEECLRVLEKLDEYDIQANCLEGLGVAVLGQGKTAWAVLLWGAAAKLREVRRILMSPFEQVEYERVEQLARIQLGDARFAEVWAQGYALMPEHTLVMQEPDAML